MTNKLSWAAPILPGNSMMGLSLGLSADEVASMLRCYLIDSANENVVKFENSPLLMIDTSKLGVIVLRALEIGQINYEWQNEALTMIFTNSILTSLIAHGLPESAQYQGKLYDTVGLGVSVTKLQTICNLEYDSAEECFFPVASDIGLVVAGSGSCDLTVDGDQKINFIRIF